MADLELTKGDTWPPMRGKAEDDDGLMDLDTAESLLWVMRSGATVVSGTATSIDPETNDGFNWSYTWAGSDTSVPGEYTGKLKVIWDTATTPDEIEWVPNEGEGNIVLINEDPL